MPQRPWAIDNLIVHDETNLRSVLIGGDGLPAARAWLSQRHGYWPRMSGLSRQGYRMTLETYLKQSTEAQRLAARTALLQVLNPELEEPVRFTVVDYVLEDIGRDGVLLAMGPWDVYCDDAGAWHVRDLLQPEDVEADLSGGWQIGWDGGLQIAEATINLEPNPSFETNTTGWATLGTNTIARSSEQSRFGCYSLLCTYQDNGFLAYDTITLTATAHTLSAWVYIPGDYDGTELRVMFGGFTGGVGTSFAAADMSLVDQWQRVIVQDYTPNAGDLTGSLSLYEMGVPTAGRYVYLDGVQCEAKAYPTPYCDGSLGPGHSWSGAAHGSTSSRTAAECNLDDHAADLVSAQMTVYGRSTIGTVPSDRGQTEYLFSVDNSGDSANNILAILFNNANDTLILYINGANRIINVGSGSLSMGDVLCWCATFDFDADSYTLDVWENDGSHYSGTSSANLSVPSGCDRFSVADNPTEIRPLNGIVDSFLILDRVWSSDEMTRWYNYGRDALNARWMDVLCEAAVPWAPGGVAALDRGLVSTLVVDEDVRWRQRDGDVAFWRIYDDTWDITIDVDSDDDVWPEFRLTPRTAKATGFAYKRWYAVKWPSENDATNYPVMIGPTDYTGKAQADGDDIRVYVDGEEVDRWLGGALINAVKVWFLADFEPDVSLTLAEAIAAAGAIDYIQFNEDITDLPVEGIIYVDSEAFTYTDKNNRTKKVTGITRATRGTAAAGHAASTAAYWIQHDVWIYYDDATLAAPVVDDDYEPAFDLDNSTNASWVYTEFGEEDGLRTMQWMRGYEPPNTDLYTANHGADANPFEEIGVFVQASTGYWTFYTPTTISNVAFSNGEKYASGDLASWDAEVLDSTDGSSWNTTYDIPAPALATNWENWSCNVAVTAHYLRLAWLSPGSVSWVYYVEAADLTLTLSDGPTATAASELDNYPLECTIANEATGEEIAITAGMILDQTLVVDTYEKSAILDDGTRLATAVVTDTVRRDWLRLVSGENPLTFEDTGTQELEIDILWHRRLFE